MRAEELRRFLASRKDERVVFRIGKEEKVERMKCNFLSLFPFVADATYGSWIKLFHVSRARLIRSARLHANSSNYPGNCTFQARAHDTRAALASYISPRVSAVIIMANSGVNSSLTRTIFLFSFSHVDFSRRGATCKLTTCHRHEFPRASIEFPMSERS